MKTRVIQNDPDEPTTDEDRAEARRLAREGRGATGAPTQALAEARLLARSRHLDATAPPRMEAHQ